MPVYKQFDQAALDRQYNLRLHVPDFADYLENGSRLSRQAERELNPLQHIAYGPSAMEQLDIYPSQNPGSKTLVFIHGGYWQRFSKADYQFVASAFHEYELTTVLIDYPLAPAVSMDQILVSCRRALEWIHQNIARYQGDPSRVYLAGHSAGAHLAAMLLTIDWPYWNLPGDFIRGAALVSGIYNLLPVLLSDLNEVLGMNREESLRNSPAELLPASPAKIYIAVGEAETDEFLCQSRDLYDAWKSFVPAEFAVLGGLNHYSIMETILDRHSVLHQCMLRFLQFQ